VVAGTLLGRTNGHNHVHYNVCRWSTPATSRDWQTCSRGALGISAPYDSGRSDPLFPGPFISPHNASIPSDVIPSTPPPAGSAPAPAVSLQVNGISGSYSASSAPYQPSIALTGGGLNAVSEIRWTWSGPTGSGSSTWRRGDSNWSRFTPSSDGRSASIRPTLVTTNDPPGAYTWTVTFRTDSGQQVARSFAVGYTVAPSVAPPSPSPPPVTPTPAPTVSLEVRGIANSYSTTTTPYQPTIALTGSALHTVTEIRWSWNGPNNGSSIWRRSDSNWSRFAPSADGRTASIRPTLVSNDPPGTYQWTVAFRTESGHQVTRSFDVRYTPASQPTPPAATTKPPVPKGASPGNSKSPGPTTSKTSVRLSWDRATGANEYDLGVRDLSTNQLVENRRVNGTSVTVTLKPGREYRWNVAACNDAGCSKYTTPIYFRTPD
jgi:hypothetical protein